MAILHSGKALTRSNKKISMNPREMKMAVSAANKADAADAKGTTALHAASALAGAPSRYCDRKYVRY
jgi:hypothetical protein